MDRLGVRVFPWSRAARTLSCEPGSRICKEANRNLPLRDDPRPNVEVDLRQPHLLRRRTFDFKVPGKSRICREISNAYPRHRYKF
jgi:hypothetical protein